MTLDGEEGQVGRGDGVSSSDEGRGGVSKEPVEEVLGMVVKGVMLISPNAGYLWQIPLGVPRGITPSTTPSSWTGGHREDCGVAETLGPAMSVGSGGTWRAPADTWHARRLRPFT